MRFLKLSFISLVLCSCGDKSSSPGQESPLIESEEASTHPSSKSSDEEKGEPISEPLEVPQTPELLVKSLQTNLLSKLNQNHPFSIQIGEAFGAEIQKGISENKRYVLDIQNVDDASYSFVYLFLTKNLFITTPDSSSEHRSYEKFVSDLTDKIPQKDKSAFYDQLDRLQPLITQAMKDFLKSKGVDSYELTVLEQIEVINNALTINPLSAVGLDNFDHISTRFLRDSQRKISTMVPVATASFNHHFSGIIFPYGTCGIFKDSALSNHNSELSILSLNHNHWFLEGRFRDLFMESFNTYQALKLGYDFDLFTLGINHYSFRDLAELMTASVEYANIYNIDNVEIRMTIAGNLGYKQPCRNKEKHLYHDISTAFNVKYSYGIAASFSLSWAPTSFTYNFSFSLEK